MQIPKRPVVNLNNRKTPGFSMRIWESKLEIAINSNNVTYPLLCNEVLTIGPLYRSTYADYLALYCVLKQ